MTREQIEQKAKEIANKYVALGFKCSYSHELYESAMKMADFILSHQWVSVIDELPTHSESESNYVLLRISFGCPIIGCFRPLLNAVKKLCDAYEKMRVSQRTLPPDNIKRRNAERIFKLRVEKLLSLQKKSEK